MVKLKPPPFHTSPFASPAHTTLNTMANLLPPPDTDESLGGIAQVTFRVRCETLGHGESVFLAQAENPSGSRVSVCSGEHGVSLKIVGDIDGLTGCYLHGIINLLDKSGCISLVGLLLMGRYGSPFMRSGPLIC